VELGYSQSSVTHHIQMLEKQLGVRLFDRFRFSRGANLTEAGKRVFDDANYILQLVDRVHRNIARSK
jgi:DNA-binding transcriptional LysR family regulator